jgi:hypothetical protein
MVTKELVHLNDQNNLFDHGIKTYSNKMNCELMLTYDTRGYILVILCNNSSSSSIWNEISIWCLIPLSTIFH